jgi:hypothetical protein
LLATAPVDIALAAKSVRLAVAATLATVTAASVGDGEQEAERRQPRR